MKTSLRKNKKFWSSALGILFIITAIVVGMVASSGIVFAQEHLIPTFISPTEIPTNDKAVQREVEVNVKYIFEDEKVYKEEKVKAEKGQLLDSGDLPILSDDMKFIDEFLFYKVKGDGKDKIIRKIAKTDVKDKETQTELSKDDISKMEKKAKELQEKLDKLNDEIKDKNKISDKQKEKIKDLEAEIEGLKDKLKKDKENKDLSADMKKEMDKLTEKIKELEKKVADANRTNATSNSISPISPISGIKVSSGDSSKTSVNNSGKETTSQTSSGTTTKDTVNTETKEKEVRYPNKLTPKTPANNNQDSSMDGTSKNVNTNKGVASAPSKAIASVTGNKDNANKDYPIHHGDNKDRKETDKYSADARQFITFQTKNGKTFHLIINHDEQGENVKLLTEASEDDLLNMVEKKEAPKQEITKEKPVKEETKLEKKEEKSNLGIYIILLLVIGGVLGAGYYFKVVKKKENRELEVLEEEDDDFFSEAESEEETENEVDEAETKDKEYDELE